MSYHLNEQNKIPQNISLNINLNDKASINS